MRRKGNTKEGSTNVLNETAAWKNKAVRGKDEYRP
jgi:hypothetical protein